MGIEQPVVQSLRGQTAVGLDPINDGVQPDVLQVPTTPACMWWNRPEEDPSSGILESTHPSRTNVKSITVFMESSRLCAATLTHYSPSANSSSR